MRDGWMKRVIKGVSRGRFVVDLKITRWIQGLRGQPPYRLRGSCCGCGGCCKTPMIQVIGAFYHLKSTRWVILTWHRVINGLELIGEERKTHTFIFRCTHWDPETKACDSYESRPGFCRDYPRPLLYLSDGLFLEGCGYGAVHRKAAHIRKALDRLDLPAEMREKLEDGLHAREEIS